MCPHCSVARLALRISTSKNTNTFKFWSCKSEMTMSSNLAGNDSILSVQSPAVELIFLVASVIGVRLGNDPLRDPQSWMVFPT
jgi:hypothetical protein